VANNRPDPAQDPLRAIYWLTGAQVSFFVVNLATDISPINEAGQCGTAPDPPFLN